VEEARAALPTALSSFTAARLGARTATDAPYVGELSLPLGAWFSCPPPPPELLGHQCSGGGRAALQS
jgi:hypothetical protein